MLPTVEVGEHIRGAQIVDIPPGDPPRALPSGQLDPTRIAELPVRTTTWGETSVEGVLARSQARSLVVLHEGRIAFEWYGPTGGPDRRNRCYSVTKSFTGTLVASAVHDGTLDRAAVVGDLLPELAASAFADATVGDVADMTVAMGYDEDYADAVDGASGGTTLGFGDYMLALGLDPSDDPDDPHGTGRSDAPRTVRTFLPTIGPVDRRHGEAFAYATPNTDVLGWLLERATGAEYPDLLGRAIWTRIGAEHVARLALDPAGTPTMGAGLAMTTRDLARFGLMLSEQGRPGAEPVVPVAAVEAIRDGGDRGAFLRSGQYDYLTGYSYRDQWWMPGGARRPMSAWGIHGQVLWVDPDASVVIATHCGGPDASDVRRDLEQDAMCRALTDHLCKPAPSAPQA
jgi:CubicO group peptidase (beta-lactamase class C family)